MKCAIAWSVLVGVVSGCGGSDPAVEPVSDAGPGSGPDTGLPADVPPIRDDCNTSQLPSGDACVLHESLGVFVSSSRGLDANDGSRERPFASFGKAVEVARASRRRVYACAEPYSEPTLQLADGVSIFANLSCEGTWAVSQLHAVLSATQSPAARAAGIAAPTRVEGLDLVAPPGGAPGESSIGLIAVDSPALQLVQSRIVAQQAANGLDGVEGTQLVQDAAFNGAQGHAAGECTRTTQGGLVFYNCPTAAAAAGGVGVCRGGGREITTGPGGAGGMSGAHEYTFNGVGYWYLRSQTSCFIVPPQAAQCNYASRQRGLPAEASAQTNVGANIAFQANSSSSVPTLETPGVAGAPGPSGPPGSNAVGLGTLSADGFVGLDGVAGTDGTPGQGGGGGAGAKPTAGGVEGHHYVGVGGPGGGAGGCPGLAGIPGKGGGASIALLAIGSPMAIERSELVAGAGGVGGRGTLGSQPTAGGAAGANDERGAKSGGPGGAAGWSGHGASGPSFAIAHSGAAPVLAADCRSEVAAPAPGQPALTEGPTTIPAAPGGLAEPLHAF